jgi:hypothetical protein
MKLRVGRLVQIMAAIQQRVKGELKLRQAETEWHAKTVSQFIIYSVEGGQKAHGPLFKMLDKISLIDPQKVERTAEADTTPSRGFSYADIEERGNFDAALERNSQRKGGLGGFAALGVTPS